ncbi:hypothetical protein [Stieleria marina]|uniref:DUF3311 domain-containing protein n=1 Tax=Stieleria marina TaxID=1930275 RepID=A0A517P330_9BACT|nr:hypothetical protein K239x_57780 [Planctomycetes bacterium K23_9]
MKTAIWICVGLLLILHQDYWQWDNATLDFGFLPRTMTYQIGLSIAAAVVWLLATHYCWPTDLSPRDPLNSDPRGSDFVDGDQTGSGQEDAS